MSPRPIFVGGSRNVFTKAESDARYQTLLSLRPDWLTPSPVGTLGTPAAATAIVTGTTYPSNELIIAPSQNRFAYCGAGNFRRVGDTFPLYNSMRPLSLNNATATQTYAIEFIYEGSGFEVIMQALVGYSMRVYVNGNYLGSAASSVANTFYPITFASPGHYTIRLVVGGGLGFGGVRADVTDSVWLADIPGPRVIVIGDSLAAGTGNEVDGPAGSLVTYFADALGIHDIWSSSIGGTGYNATGTAVKIRDRLQQDVINYAPDYVVWVAGHNDTAFTTAQNTAEISACIDMVGDQLDDCQQLVGSPLWAPGISLGQQALGVRDILATAAQTRGLPFVDQLEMPLAVGAVARTGVIGTSGMVATGSVFKSATAWPTRTTIKIGPNLTGAYVQRVLTAVSGPVSGEYTCTINSAVSATYGPGTAITEVGPDLFVGSGSTGAPAGNGNSDVLNGADGVHFSARGHRAVGHWLARSFVRELY